MCRVSDNGSGKSTITRQLDFGGKERLLDPDAVARRMAPEDVTRFALAPGREVLSLTRQYLSAGLSFAVETTLAGKGPIKTMRRARERGFEVVLLYICLDSPERNVRRVQERVVQGGHSVPGEDIRRRYERSLENPPEAISLSGRAVLMDNSASDMKPVPETVDGKLTCLAPDPPNRVSALLSALS